MKRGRLPLTALRSFEAAGRHLSFTRGAEELFVSEAAVSRQIRDLEALVGVALFERLHRRVELTVAGRHLLHQLTESFDAIDRKLTEIGAHPRHDLVKVSAEPFFAGAWLIPMLNRFRELHPGIDVAVDAGTRLVEFRTHEADLAIRHSKGPGEWPRTQSRHLVDSIARPVVSPNLLAKGPPLNSVSDLAAHTLLHEESRDAWALWLAVAAPDNARPERGPIFGDGTLTTRAAALGHGVALGDPFLNGAEIRDGSLVEPFQETVAFGSYWLVAPDFAKLSPPARTFADWLVAEVAAQLTWPNAPASRASSRSGRSHPPQHRK